MFARCFAPLAASVLTAYAAAFAGASHAACLSVPDAALVSPGHLMLSTNPTLAPLQYIDSAGELKGMNIDLGNAIAKRLCLTTDFVRMDFPAMVPAMQAGRFDGIDTGMFWTEARAKMMYTVPYALATISIVVNPDSNAHYTDIKQLAGHSLGVEADSYQEKWLRDRAKEIADAGGKPMEIHSFQTASDVMAALHAKQLDVAALPSYAAGGVVAGRQAKLALAGLGNTQTTMAFRQRAVAEAVAQALDAMRADGSYAKILDAYGMTKLPAPHIAVVGGPA